MTIVREAVLMLAFSAVAGLTAVGTHRLLGFGRWIVGELDTSVDQFVDVATS